MSEKISLDSSEPINKNNQVLTNLVVFVFTRSLIYFFLYYCENR